MKISKRNKEKPILEVCYPCGIKYGKKKDGEFGSWIGRCDICHKKTGVASAPHDYGIYSSKKIELEDKIQRQI